MAQLKPTEVEQFLGALRALMRSGLPVPDGLRALAASAESGRLRDMALAVAADAERGRPLADAHADHPAAGSELVALVRCSEGASGAEVLDAAVVNARARRNLHHDLTIAMLYPLTMLVTMAGILQFLARISREDFLKFTSLGWTPGDLEGQFAYRLLEFLATPIGALLSLVPLAFLVAFVYEERFRMQVLERLCRFPGVGNLVALSDTAQLFGALAAYLRGGVPLPEALRGASVAVHSIATRTAVERMAASAERGNPIAPELPPWAPSTARLLMEQGEANGQLTESLEAAAECCRDAYVRRGRAFTEFVNPLLLLMVGVLVSVLFSGLFLPMFKLPGMIK